jgi:hypothetical protein
MGQGFVIMYVISSDPSALATFVMMAGLCYAVTLFVYYSLNHNLIESYQRGRDMSDQERSYILQSRFSARVQPLRLSILRDVPRPELAGRSCAVQSCEARVDGWLWALRLCGNAKRKGYAARFCLTRFSPERCRSFICSVETTLRPRSASRRSSCWIACRRSCLRP